ncbi:unnamed protein product [Zymoseptoria tritici ST99CH_1A5]|uniref:DUF654-domain-containing protein n=1 Tax=Zymoseptoria tritici ST99CH_1A5 TaxID=1276529 RepID=A0A1Y6LZ42_ZYMTR|nr:unnamed protein product [Zymoseptoria tritici ST99CH_1A5]
MSSRALRKAQREKEEQDRLKQLEQEARALEEDQEESEEEEVPAATIKKSAFAMLEEEGEDDAEPEADDTDEDDEPAPVPAATVTPKGSSSKKKKKKKKAKAGITQEVGAKEEDLDEIDAALKQLSTNGKASETATATASAAEKVNEECRLLAIDTTHLHAQNEMKRLFGRAALEQDEDEDAPAPPGAAGGNRRQNRRVQQVGLAAALRGNRQDGRSGLAAMALRRNIFVQGKEEWPSAASGGLGMEITEKRSDGTVLYRFVHNSTYKSVQREFHTCVASMDPQRMIILLQHNPYHISTLLQVSEIAKQERDPATAGDLLSRALFSFGRAVHSTFPKALAEGRARLDFRYAANREFYLAVWRYSQNLAMRALWRTVYEWSKLLLALEPANDPYALSLVLDHYALRSNQHTSYLALSRSQLFPQPLPPQLLLSQSLAEFRAGNDSQAQRLLFKTVTQHPYLPARLLQELNQTPSPGIWGAQTRTDHENLLTELYAIRAKDIWNSADALAFLLETCAAVQRDVVPPAAPDTREISRNEARHVLLCDEPKFIELIPRKLSQMLESTGDPLPPEDRITTEGEETVIESMHDGSEDMWDARSILRLLGRNGQNAQGGGNQEEVLDLLNRVEAGAEEEDLDEIRQRLEEMIRGEAQAVGDTVADERQRRARVEDASDDEA